MADSGKVIDLRSDTVTHPTEAMRKAMAEAEVGDDVLGEDPTVIRLEEMAAGMMGKEAGLFTASGTMSNLVATLTHCSRGDEVLMGSEAHMFWNESAAASTLAAVQPRLVPNDQRGMLEPAEVGEAIRPPGNLHMPPTTLLCLENTHNRCNGGVLNSQETSALARVAHEGGLAVHLDGARIFNAAVALETPARELTRGVDDISFCLSKGLSAPVGSVLCGSRDFVDRARRWRKMVGGGMRQAGVLAAAGIVALETMVDRLAEDHANVRRLGHGLAEIEGIEVDPDLCQTNILFVGVTPALGSIRDLMDRLAQAGVKTSYSGGPRARMVTHRHISQADVDVVVDRAYRVSRDMLASAAV